MVFRRLLGAVALVFAIVASAGGSSARTVRASRLERGQLRDTALQLRGRRQIPALVVDM